jgi:hypothetical protein
VESREEELLCAVSRWRGGCLVGGRGGRDRLVVVICLTCGQVESYVRMGCVTGPASFVSMYVFNTSALGVSEVTIVGRRRSVMESSLFTFLEPGCEVRQSCGAVKIS